METFSETNDTDELPKGVFPITLRIVYQYQRKYPGLMDKFKCSAYQRGYFNGGSNNNLFL